jgi:hypothetical protein
LARPGATVLLPAAGALHNGLGELLREWNRLDEAVQHLMLGIEVCRRWNLAG